MDDTSASPAGTRRYNLRPLHRVENARHPPVATEGECVEDL